VSALGCHRPIDLTGRHDGRDDHHGGRFPVEHAVANWKRLISPRAAAG
jgi:hypothetical protein